MNGNVLALHMYCFSPGLTAGKCKVKSDKSYSCRNRQSVTTSGAQDFSVLGEGFLFPFLQEQEVMRSRSAYGDVMLPVLIKVQPLLCRCP